MGEFTATLEDVMVIARLPLFGDHSPRGIILGEEEEKTSELLKFTLRVLTKSTYTSEYGTS